jgi:hypothetical protein
VTPLVQIREGIKTGNWIQVCGGFTAMTGEEVKPPSMNVNIDFGSASKTFFENLGRCITDYLRDHPIDIASKPDITRTERQGVLSSPPITLPPVKTESVYCSTEPVEDAVSVRARQLKDAKAGGDITDQFRIKHGNPKKSDKGVEAKKSPIVPGMTNKFVDTMEIATGDIESDRALLAKVKPTERRPESVLVEVVCSRCNKKESVAPILAPTKIQGEASTYVCNSCIGKK